ncbi:hypothetical protein FP414_23040 [Escherichia coli]
MLNDTKKNIRGYSTAPLVLIYGHHDIPAPAQHNGTHCHQTRHPGNILVALSTTDTSGYAIQLPALAEKPQEYADRQHEENTREPAAPEYKEDNGIMYLHSKTGDTITIRECISRTG